MYDKKQTDVDILLTQKPVSAELFFDDEKFYDAMLNGSVVGLKINLDLDERPCGKQVKCPVKLANELSGCDGRGWMRSDALGRASAWVYIRPGQWSGQ